VFDEMAQPQHRRRRRTRGVSGITEPAAWEKPRHRARGMREAARGEVRACVRACRPRRGGARATGSPRRRSCVAAAERRREGHRFPAVAFVRAGRGEEARGPPVPRGGVRALPTRRQHKGGGEDGSAHLAAVEVGSGRRRGGRGAAPLRLGGGVPRSWCAPPPLSSLPRKWRRGFPPECG
jgi:hypothetical protein